MFHGVSNVKSRKKENTLASVVSINVSTITKRSKSIICFKNIRFPKRFQKHETKIKATIAVLFWNAILFTFFFWLINNRTTNSAPLSHHTYSTVLPEIAPMIPIPQCIHLMKPKLHSQCLLNSEMYEMINILPSQTSHYENSQSFIAMNHRGIKKYIQFFADYGLSSMPEKDRIRDCKKAYSSNQGSQQIIHVGCTPSLQDATKRLAIEPFS